MKEEKRILITGAGGNLGDTGQAAKGQKQQTVQGMALAQPVQPSGNLQQGSEQAVRFRQKQMGDQVQQIEQNHIAAQAEYAL